MIGVKKKNAIKMVIATNQIETWTKTELLQSNHIDEMINKISFFANLNYIDGNVQKKHFEWNFNQFNAKAGITTYAPSNHVILVSLDINYSYVSPCPCRWSCDCARAPSMNNSPMRERASSCVCEYDYDFIIVYFLIGLKYVNPEQNKTIEFIISHLLNLRLNRP